MRDWAFRLRWIGTYRTLSVPLTPAATISGKVRHSDGEPAVGVTVLAYRELYERNRHEYEVASDRSQTITASIVCSGCRRATTIWPPTTFRSEEKRTYAKNSFATAMGG